MSFGGGGTVARYSQTITKVLAITESFAIAARLMIDGTVYCGRVYERYPPGCARARASGRGLWIAEGNSDPKVRVYYLRVNGTVNSLVHLCCYYIKAYQSARGERPTRKPRTDQSFNRTKVHTRARL